MSCNTI